MPLKTWEKINQEYTKLQNKIKVLTGIKDGFKEVKEARETGKKLQTLANTRQQEVRDYLAATSMIKK